MAYEGFAPDMVAAPAAGTRSCPSSCQHCPSRRSCLAADLGTEETRRWSELVSNVNNLAAGKTLFECGDVAQTVYSVRAGCIKTFTLDADGNERVRGFHLAGDVIGLDALTQDRYPMHAVAVAPTQVCQVSRNELRQFATLTPALMNRLVESLSHSLRSALSLAGDHSAEQRVAAFLLHMHSRLEPLPGRPLRLPMGRRDIANYLRLATETVCRVLTRFEQAGHVAVRDREVTLRAPAALRELAQSLMLDTPATALH